MKKIALSIFLILIAFSAFAASLYETAVISGTSETIAIFANRLAGPDGSVIYFEPGIKKPTNSNYEYAGVTVKNSYGVVIYTFLTDKISGTANIYQVAIDDKTVSLDGGATSDWDVIEKVYMWECSSSQYGLAPTWENNVYHAGKNWWEE